MSNIILLLDILNSRYHDKWRLIIPYVIFFTPLSYVTSLLFQVSQVMTNKYVKILLNLSLREALKCMQNGQQNCVIVVDAEDHLEGILTLGDIRRFLSKNSSDSSSSDSSVPDVCNND